MGPMPIIGILAATTDDFNAFETVDNVVDATAFDAKGLGGIVNKNSGVDPWRIRRRSTIQTNEFRTHDARNDLSFRLYDGSISSIFCTCVVVVEIRSSRLTTGTTGLDGTGSVATSPMLPTATDIPSQALF
eukprot:scaffold102654_cov59-Attheya_sp.AAC.1